MRRAVQHPERGARPPRPRTGLRRISTQSRRMTRSRRVRDRLHPPDSLASVQRGTQHSQQPGLVHSPDHPVAGLHGSAPRPYPGLFGRITDRTGPDARVVR